MAKNGTLKNLRILIHDLLKRKGRSFNDDGLSILELVVAMGIILVITGTSIGVYNGINSNAKHASVERAADTVLKGAMLYESDGLSDTNPMDAKKQWDDSNNSDIEVKIEREDVGGEIFVTASYGDGSGISTSRSVNPNGSTCIDGILVGGKNTGDACVSGEKDPEIPGPAIGDTVSRLTYKCDADTTGYLAVTGIVGGTKITMAGSDGSSKLVKYSNKSYMYLYDGSTATEKNENITDNVTMKSNVKYSVIINGQFDKLATPRSSSENAKDSLAHCLTKVDKIGENAGVTHFNSFGGDKLISVPNSIPSSVKTFSKTFYNAYEFNDSNVSKWDTSGVTSLYAMFYGAKDFNQPLNDWNTSNVTSMHAVFYRAESFNQNLDNWNTGKVSTMSSMFGYANSFNEDIRNWDTSNVQNMASMFIYNKKFNRNLKNWDTSKVTNMNKMFYGSTFFNQDVSMWNIDRVTDSGDFNTGGILTPEKIPEKFRN